MAILAALVSVPLFSQPAMDDLAGWTNFTARMNRINSMLDKQNAAELSVRLNWITTANCTAIVPVAQLLVQNLQNGVSVEPSGKMLLLAGQMRLDSASCLWPVVSRLEPLAKAYVPSARDATDPPPSAYAVVTWSRLMPRMPREAAAIVFAVQNPNIRLNDGNYLLASLVPWAGENSDIARAVAKGLQFRSPPQLRLQLARSLLYSARMFPDVWGNQELVKGVAAALKTEHLPDVLEVLLNAIATSASPDPAVLEGVQQLSRTVPPGSTLTGPLEAARRKLSAPKP